jgi:uncharacterized protein (TIGR02186 family)
MTRLILFLLLLFPLPALAAPLIADLSNYRIDIDSGFNGTRLFLFGARNDNGDIVAVIRGPAKNYIVRKKEEIAGIWINRQRIKFFDIPDFYAIASAKPLDAIQQSAIAKQLGIGENNLLPYPANANALTTYNPFADAFLRHQHKHGLYAQTPESINFMGETLFKTVIEFPSNLPPGDYTAEFYLIAGNDIVGMQSTPIRVVKSGLDAFLYGYAHEYPFLYGMTAVMLALVIGWFTGKMFEHI